MSNLRFLEAWHKDPVTLQPYATFRVTTPCGLEVTASRDGAICYPSARLSPTQALELAGALRVVAEWVEWVAHQPGSLTAGAGVDANAAIDAWNPPCQPAS